MFSEPENLTGADGAAARAAGSWRERALERSLEAPRARSVDRLERLVGAARDLANEIGTSGFTVSQVAQRAGLSLKSFYRCFASKDDLLVALLEEDSRTGAVILAEVVAEQSEPDARLRAFVVGVFELLLHPGALGYAGVLVREQRRLSEARPDDMRRALAPLVDLLGEEIAGVVSAPDPRDSHTVFSIVLEGIHEVTLGRVDALDQADYVWRFCQRALHTTEHDIKRDIKEHR